MITYNDKSYAFKLEKILNFYANGENGKNKETEIIDIYEMDADNSPKIVSKQTREVKSNSPTQNENIRYDLIKMFISVLLENNTDVKNDDEITFDIGTSLAFNTLLDNGYLYEINK